MHYEVSLTCPLTVSNCCLENVKCKFLTTAEKRMKHIG